MTCWSLFQTLRGSFLLRGVAQKIKAGFKRFPWDLGLDIKAQVEGHHSWYN